MAVCNVFNRIKMVRGMAFGFVITRPEEDSKLQNGAFSQSILIAMV
jgi:hypothetical protein